MTTLILSAPFDSHLHLDLKLDRTFDVLHLTVVIVCPLSFSTTN
jgi:hypothetical protein